MADSGPPAGSRAHAPHVTTGRGPVSKGMVRQHVQAGREAGCGDGRSRDLEDLRQHGFGVAYRMLGSVSEAEDVDPGGALAADAPGRPDR